MTDTLTRAANDAAETLGMEVGVTASVVDHYIIAVHPPIDSEESGLPVATCEWQSGAARAYLEGLECGARIMRERYRPLVAVSNDIDIWWGFAKCPLRPDALITANDEQPISNALREALANLED